MAKAQTAKQARNREPLWLAPALVYPMDQGPAAPALAAIGRDYRREKGAEVVAVPAAIPHPNACHADCHRIVRVNVAVDAADLGRYADLAAHRVYHLSGMTITTRGHLGAVGGISAWPIRRCF